MCRELALEASKRHPVEAMHRKPQQIEYRVTLGILDHGQVRRKADKTREAVKWNARAWCCQQSHHKEWSHPYPETPENDAKDSKPLNCSSIGTC